MAMARNGQEPARAERAGRDEYQASLEGGARTGAAVAPGAAAAPPALLNAEGTIDAEWARRRLELFDMMAQVEREAIQRRMQFAADIRAEIQRYADDFIQQFKEQLARLREEVAELYRERERVAQELERQRQEAEAELEARRQAEAEAVAWQRAELERQRAELEAWQQRVQAEVEAAIQRQRGEAEAEIQRQRAAAGEEVTRLRAQAQAEAEAIVREAEARRSEVAAEVRALEQQVAQIQGVIDSFFASQLQTLRTNLGAVSPAGRAAAMPRVPEAAPAPVAAVEARPEAPLPEWEEPAPAVAPEAIEQAATGACGVAPEAAAPVFASGYRGSEEQADEPERGTVPAAPAPREPGAAPATAEVVLEDVPAPPAGAEAAPPAPAAPVPSGLAGGPAAGPIAGREPVRGAVEGPADGAATGREPAPAVAPDAGKQPAVEPATPWPPRGPAPDTGSAGEPPAPAGAAGDALARTSLAGAQPDVAGHDRGGASDALVRTSVVISGVPGFSRALAVQRAFQQLGGVREVKGLGYDRGVLGLEVQHDASLDLAARATELPGVRLRVVASSAGRLQLAAEA
jgi:hypothetical protein